MMDVLVVVGTFALLFVLAVLNEWMIMRRTQGVRVPYNSRIKDMPFVTIEQVNRLRDRAMEIERELDELRNEKE